MSECLASQWCGLQLDISISPQSTEVALPLLGREGRVQEADKNVHVHQRSVGPADCLRAPSGSLPTGL